MSCSLKLRDLPQTQAAGCVSPGRRFPAKLIFIANYNDLGDGEGLDYDYHDDDGDAYDED